MPNEPSIPSLPDLLSTLAGMGRGMVNRLPNTPLPNLPLQPFFGGHTPDISPRTIGEMMLPQSMLDVGLMAVPGGKPLSKIGKLRSKIAEDFLVPAFRHKGKEHIGRPGKEVFHTDIMARDGIDISEVPHTDTGYVNSLTGEWLTMGEAAEQEVTRRSYRKLMGKRTKQFDEAFERAEKKRADILTTKAAKE